MPIRLVIADSVVRGEPIATQRAATHSPNHRDACGMNERLPALTARDVIRTLERAGFAVSRTSGSHCRLIHQVDSARNFSVPVHSGDLKRGTLRAIIAQAGMTVAEFLQFL